MSAVIPTFAIHRKTTPEIYWHVFEAIHNKGQPSLLTYWPMEDPDNPRINPAPVNPNRVQAMAHNVEHFVDIGGLARMKGAGVGKSWDEYPFACTLEGGTDSSVVAVPVSEQQSQGGSLGSFIKAHKLTRGDVFKVVLSPPVDEDSGSD